MVPMIPKENVVKKVAILSKHEKIHHLSCLSPHFKIYTAQFLSTWSQRMWEFAEGLFLIQITPGSLRLVAIFNFAMALTIIALGSAIGRWVDRRNRLSAIRVSLIIQNTMVSLCTMLLCLLITYESYFTISLNGWTGTIIQIAVILIACAAQIGNTGSKLSLEKDWIVVLSKGKESTLASLNSVVRTLDLSTQIMAPLLVGVVINSFGTVIGGILVASWNFVSVILQYFLLQNIYNSNDSLQKPKLTSQCVLTKQINTKLEFLSKAKDAGLMWQKYFLHQIKLAGLALAFLYMTVISFDSYTIAYLYYNGISQGLLGILQSCASISGILGAIIFPMLHRQFGLLKVGNFGFNFEVFCLVFCVAAMFAPGTVFDPLVLISTGAFFSNNSNSSRISNDLGDNEHVTTMQLPELSRNSTSIILLLIGIITSRAGLFIADLAVTQVLQEDVAESERGGINGVQYSLCQSFSMLRSAILIILPSMATFGYLVILSFIFVATASLLFGIYALQKVQQIKKIDQVEITRF